MPPVCAGRNQEEYLRARQMRSRVVVSVAAIGAIRFVLRNSLFPIPHMVIYPAMDIYEGRCVRLRQGDFAQRTIYGDYPSSVALAFHNLGFTHLHIVDLEGARQKRVVNIDALRGILTESAIRAQVGGGIRRVEDIETLVSMGAGRVVVGSIAVEAPALIGEWIERFGADRIAVASDLRDGCVALVGWEEQSERRYEEFVAEMEGLGVRSFLCTDINHDGMLDGTNIQLYDAIRNSFPSIELIASGGVRGIDDLHVLESIGVDGVIIGKAWYEGRVRVTDLYPWMNEVPPRAVDHEESC